MPSVADKEWFKARFKERGLSRKKVAEAAGIHYLRLTRQLAGELHWHPQEVASVASVLDLPIEEIMQRIGVEIPGGIAPFPIIGTVNWAGEISELRTWEQRKVKAPFKLPKSLVGLRVLSPYHPLNGSIVFYTPSRRLNRGALGRLSVVQVFRGKRYLCVPEKAPGYDMWTLKIRYFSDQDRDHSAQMVDWSAPVAWIKPQW